VIARQFFLMVVLATAIQAAMFDFPTDNRALLEDRPQDFYMYVDRNFEGVSTKVWEGGSFGYVRGPQRQGEEVVYLQLHEGIDIAPMRRDRSGKPLDDIRASAAGRVAHVSHEAGASNYGRYIVIEHDIEGSPVYTLYAHLSSISVESGQKVAQGEVIGRMGFTGAGINCERAHLHFEIALLLNTDFESWYKRYFSGTPNKHGPYHGYNLSGIDPAKVLLECAKDPAFQFSNHIRGQEAFYKITIPATSPLSILRSYPWLVPNGEEALPPAWTIAFNRYGTPMCATASPKTASAPEIAWIRETPFAYNHTTRGIIGGSKGGPRLTDSGKRFLDLLARTDPKNPIDN
jgi:murein DD-endopeptidase MepM/ murein hydrolase activator NlpD